MGNLDRYLTARITRHGISYAELITVTNSVKIEENASPHSILFQSPLPIFSPTL